MKLTPFSGVEKDDTAKNVFNERPTFYVRNRMEWERHVAI